MRNFLLTFTMLPLVLGGGPARASDWGHLYGYVDWTTDYRFYGVSESDRHATMQGGLHWAAPDDFYVGVFTSGVDFKDFRNTSYEVDFYGGRHFYFDDNDLNLEILYGVDPDIAGHPSYAPPGVILPNYNFFEAAGELTHSFGAFNLGGKAILEPRPVSHGGFLWSLNGAATYSLNDWLKVSANVGRQWEKRVDSTHWDFGVTATWRQQWVFDVRYYGTNISIANCYHMTWCQPALVGKITYQFAVL